MNWITIGHIDEIPLRGARCVKRLHLAFRLGAAMAGAAGAGLGFARRPVARRRLGQVGVQQQRRHHLLADGVHRRDGVGDGHLQLSALFFYGVRSDGHVAEVV